MFLIRQWRKIVTLAWYNADHSADVKLVRFEDLLSDPERWPGNCANSGDFHENMTDRPFTDGAGQPWRQKHPIARTQARRRAFAARWTSGNRC